MKAVRVPVKLRYIRKPALCRNATGIHLGSAGALPETTGVKLGRCYTVSAGGVTVYRALPGRCRLSPGHYRRQPGLCRDAAGFHRGSTGDNRVRVDRDSAGLLTGFNRGGTGK
ncbi:hypothetical protein DPMN_069218 [Dreissena polymorpha]|uniref:Uncharacterized protein n=1 Tax=Dreissena polymorpha TaxID=45954 RepID=A0A9D3Z3Z5_DREPO|nr:hypothetical protein DPMN_069218 [Dreissena polymorpha]